MSSTKMEMFSDEADDAVEDCEDIEFNVALDHRPDVLAAHKEILGSALADAALWCYGIKAIEVWVKTGGCMTKVEGGTWINPDYLNHEDPDVKTAVANLYEEDAPDFQKYHSDSYPPGVGLPGILFAESKMPTRRASTVTLMSKRSLIKTINWRNISGLASDPDQPHNPRLNIMVNAGFGVAAGIPFSVDDIDGVVIYIAHEYETSLSTMKNEKYMLTATQHIGVVQSLLKPRLEVAEDRTKKVRGQFHKAKRLITVAGKISKPQNTENNKNEKIIYENKKGKSKKIQNWIGNDLKPFCYQWLQKMRGANIPPPPTPSPSLAMFNLVASFVTCFIMVAFKARVISKIELREGCKDATFENGLTASVVMIIYALTPAPAAQPRNIILGQLIAMLTGMTFALIPRDLTDFAGTCPPRITFSTPLEWFRFSGAIATATGLSFGLGVPHPPGAGLVLLFLNYPWNEMITYPKLAFTLLQDIMFIVIASMLNNLHFKKQYPTYWGHIPNLFSRNLRGLLCKEEKEMN